MLDPQYIGVEHEEVEGSTASTNGNVAVAPTRTGVARRRHSQAAPRPKPRLVAEPGVVSLGQQLELENIDASSPTAIRRRAGLMYRVSTWLALRSAPLCSAFYDLQMQIGKGVRQVEHRVQLADFPTNAPVLKIAFLSDLHYGPMSGRVAARQAWKLVRDAEPDVLLLGGDYLYADERGLPSLLKELQRLQQYPPRGGIYACLGNHDYYAGRDTIVTCLQACGVKVLINEAMPLPTPWKGVWIAGVDDFRCGEPNLGRALEKISPDATTLLLAHEPDVCADQHFRRASLTFCGHTHGGQVCLPKGDALYVPSKVGRDYAYGLIRHAGQWLFVSRGVGTVGVPMRMFCPPEVAIFQVTGRTMRRATFPTGRVMPLKQSIKGQE